VSTEFASNAVDTLSVAMLIVAIALVTTRSLSAALLLFALQSAMLAAAGLCTGIATESLHVIAGAGLAFAVKAVITPAVLWTMLRRTSVSNDVSAIVSRRTSIALAVIVALTMARSLNGEPFHTAIGAERALPTAVAVMVIGLQLMITSRQAVAQVIGFLVLENGMALAALTAIYGMPLVVEFGILLDLLLAVAVVFIYTTRMHLIFGSLDTAHFRNLRG
jgi:hydrogenase-4 component E